MRKNFIPIFKSDHIVIRINDGYRWLLANSKEDIEDKFKDLVEREGVDYIEIWTRNKDTKRIVRHVIEPNELLNMDNWKSSHYKGYDLFFAPEDLYKVVMEDIEHA